MRLLPRSFEITITVMKEIYPNVTPVCILVLKLYILVITFLPKPGNELGILLLCGDYWAWPIMIVEYKGFETKR